MAFNTSILDITLTGAGTEIPTLNVTDPYTSYLITGSATAIGNYAIVPTGTPQLGTTFLFTFNGILDITTNSKTFSLFGVNITQAQLSKSWEASCYYNGSSWDVDLKMDFAQSGIISSDNLTDLSVTTNKLANLAVTSTKIAADAVTTVKVLDSNITTPKIADDAVTTIKILDNNVTTNKINPNAVTNARLAQMAAYTIKGNNTGALADPQDISASTLINANAWSLTGNSGTVAGTNFIGTTDAIDLVFKVNNTEAGRIGLSNIATSFGIFSLNSNVSSSQSSAFGAYSLQFSTTGDRNTGVGYSSLNNVISGSYNTAIGADSGVSINTGNGNTCIGENALSTLESGSYNTCVGYTADVNSNVATKRIALGYGAVSNADYQFAIPADVTHLNFALNSHNKGATLISDGTGIGTWATITVDSTAGDSATINKIAGRFRKDTSGATFTLTNSYITANSVIILCPANAAIDATATTWTVSAGSGSATITFNAAPTSNFDMNFWVIN